MITREKENEGERERKNEGEVWREMRERDGGELERDK